MLLRWTFLAFFLLQVCLLAAQRDTIPDVAPLPDLNEQRLEDLLNDSEEEGEFDLNTAFEDLAVYQKNPLNLNKVSEQDLLDLRLLSDVQISNFLNYRQQVGELITTYELQAIDGWDLSTIKRVLPFVGLKSNVDDFQASLKEMFANGDNELYLRWNRILEKQKGFLPFPENPDSSAYLGDPNQYYVRYRHLYSNRLSVSLGLICGFGVAGYDLAIR
ncbi:MAG: helix-hairpin-helix domain-containing protein, partial [Bacteroidota bacterium]